MKPPAPLACPSCGRSITITERPGRDPVTEHAPPLCRAALGYRRRQVLVVRAGKVRPEGRRP